MVYETAVARDKDIDGIICDLKMVIVFLLLFFFLYFVGIIDIVGNGLIYSNDRGWEKVKLLNYLPKKVQSKICKSVV